MATCKDCLHVEVCREYVMGLAAARGVELNEAEIEQVLVSDDCENFKDRSQFVELPCNVGERLYVLFPKGRAIVEYVVIAFWIEETGTIIRAVDTRFFTTTIFFIKDIGTKAFLTKKEAEQALKEREENA